GRRDGQLDRSPLGRDLIIHASGAGQWSPVWKLHAKGKLMSDSVSSPSNKRLKGSAAYFAAIVAALALAVAGIEISRRLKAPAAALTDASAPRPFPRELRDANGETLNLQREPQRIVSQTLGTDEILLAICPPERVVALSNLAEDENYSNA